MRAKRSRGLGLASRLRALSAAVEEADGRLSNETLQPARTVLAQVGQRLRISGDATVAALAGATGSGKSSLLNALAGAELATPGVRRPTTSETLAVTFGAESAEELLDWLKVSTRHGSTKYALDDLVLLDLPDHDSTQAAHRAEVDRLVALVDMMVWVLDPQKYADAALHHNYLVPLARQAEVMIVVVNQIDRLRPGQGAEIVADLRRLLDSEGLERVDIVAVSARTGEGISALRDRLARTAADKRAATMRLAADVKSAARGLVDAAGEPSVVEIDKNAVRKLERQLASAAGVDVVGDAVAGAWRHRGALATGWPMLAWLGRLRADPLHRLRLGMGRGKKREIEPTEVSRSSLPTVGVERARAETAVRDLVGGVSSGLTRPWRDAVRRAAHSRDDRLYDDLDRAVGQADLGVDRRPVWWQIVRAVQWILMAAIAAGLGWMLVSFLLVYLRLPPLPPVTWWEIPAPLVLAVGGALAGVLVAGLARIGVEVGARRRSRRAVVALRRAIGEVAWADIVEPVSAELERYSIMRAAAAEAAS